MSRKSSTASETAAQQPEVKDSDVKPTEVKDSEVKPTDEVKDSEVKPTEVKDSEVKTPEVIPPPYEETKAGHLTHGEHDDQVKDVEKQKDVKKIPYPKSVFFIIINEFCERFNYYGMRTVLTLYMRNILGFDEDLATVLYHTFIMLCYFSPVIGAIVADNYLGKFKTILSLSIFYAFGSIILSIAAIPNFLPQTAFSMLGLLIIAFGTGGIKPCVSAFGGDQFVRPQQDKQLEQFFSVFYFSINAGSLLSTFLTPILREVSCFGEDSCFSLAFGVPAILMLVAVVIFVFGKPLYKIKKPEGNILGDFARCIGRGIKRRFKVKGEKHDHWLDYAGDKYSKQLIEDTKRVLAVGLVFVPLPVFWTLYDQQGSRWTFQATRMNGDLGGGVVLKPDQMQIVNPLLILLMVPLFESVIYPLFKKCGLLTPLQRIGCGLVLCGLSFVVSAFVEIALEPTYARIPGPTEMRLNFISTVPCNVSVNYYVGNKAYEANFNQTFFVEGLTADQEIFILNAVTVDETCDNNVHLEAQNVTLGTGSGTKGYSIYITENNEATALDIFRTVSEEQIEKSISGDPYIAFLHIGYAPYNFTIKNQKKGYTYTFTYNVSEILPDTYAGSVLETEYKEVEIGSYDIYLGTEPTDDSKIGMINNLIQGGVYRILLKPNETDANNNDYHVVQVEITSPNTVSILWLLPQYFVVTTGEVLFSVTGLSFSFTQAPVTMKSVMQAMWNMVVAFGNLIVIIIEGAKTGLSQRDEFFLFAGIMGVAAIIFTFLAIRYEYVDEDADKKPKKDELRDQDSARKSSSSLSTSSSDDDIKPEDK